MRAGLAATARTRGVFASGMWQKAAWVGAGATMGIALSLAITVDANRDAKSTIPLDELRTFSEVYSRVRNGYVESVSDKKLIEQAIGGMVSSLIHTRFFSMNRRLGPSDNDHRKVRRYRHRDRYEDGFIKVILAH